MHYPDLPIDETHTKEIRNRCFDREHPIPELPEIKQKNLFYDDYRFLLRSHPFLSSHLK